MTMKKIIKEWRTFQNLNEGNSGLYRLMNIPEGTLDVFLNVFTGSIPVELERWIRQNYGKQEPEVYEKLKNGFSYNWYSILGPKPTEELIAKMVEIYHDELANASSERGLPTFLQKPEEDMTPSEKRTYRRIMKKREKQSQSPELEWISDKDNFDELMKMIRVPGVRGDVEYSDIKSGLFGQMNDWWLGSEMGSKIFEREMSKKFHGGK